MNVYVIMRNDSCVAVRRTQEEALKFIEHRKSLDDITMGFIYYRFIELELPE